MFIFILVVYVIVSIFLIFIVLLQMGKGAEMGAAFGSVGQGQLPHTPENFLGKITTYVAIVFMLLSFGLAYLSSQNSADSVLDTIKSSNQEKAVDQATGNEATANENLDATK